MTVHAVIHQPQATVIFIFDEAIRRNRISPWSGIGPPVDRVKHIRQAGGEVLEAMTLETLSHLMASRFHVHRGQVLETLFNYNHACINKDASLLPVPKSGGLDPITTPPFYAIRMLPGITFPYGGVKINANAEVLDATNTPITGLYAVGVDAGGIYTFGYTGGLALGLAFGRIAGKNAASLA